MLDLHIDGKRLIPARLIPFITGWKFSPDTVVRILANTEQWHRVFIKSYHLDPVTVTECIVELSSKKMPGFAPFEPMRKDAYKGYTRMISLKKAEKPEVVLKELQESFGSARGLADAHRNYAESYMECISTVTNRVLDAQDGAEEEVVE